MPAPSSKSMLVLAVLAVVLSASLLLVSIPGYDGEDGVGAAEDQTTTDWSEAKAVVFNDDEPTGYKTIQAAINDIKATNGQNRTVYIVSQKVENTISIDSESDIVLKGIQISDVTEPTEPTEPVEVKLEKSADLKGPVISVNGALEMHCIIINGNSIDNGSCAIRVRNLNPEYTEGYLVMYDSSIIKNIGVAIDVEYGYVKLDQDCSLITKVSSEEGGVITSYLSNVHVYGSSFNGSEEYFVYALFDDEGSDVTYRNGVGLSVYMEGMSVEVPGEVPIYLGYRIQPSQTCTYLEVKYDEDIYDDNDEWGSSPGSVSVTLEDGIPLGYPVISCKNVDVIKHDARIAADSDGWFFTVTEITGSPSKMTLKQNGTVLSNQLITLHDGNDIIFAGITDSDGSVSYPSELSGLYNLSGSNSYGWYYGYGAVEIGSGSDGVVDLGSDIMMSGEIFVRSTTTDDLSSELEFLMVSATIVDIPLSISSILSSRQSISESVDITVEGISSMVFSLELPDGIDPDRVILFREHDGFVTEMGYVPSSSFSNRTDDCFTVEYIGGSYYVTVRSSQFSVFAVGEEEPAPSPPPERTVVTAVIEDRQVRISVDPESYKEYSVRDSEGNLLLLGWQSGASGLTIRFDLLPPGAEYRVMGRYAGTTSEILEATIVAPKDPVIEVVSVGVDSVILSSEEMVEYRLLLEDGTPVGGWVPGDGEDKGWADLDPTLDYYAEATSTSDGMTLSTGPVLVKAGVSAEVTGVMKHGGAFLVVTGVGQGLSCTADAAVYHSSGTSVTFGPIQTGTVTLTFTGSDGGEVRTMEVLVPLVPQDSGDDADVITIDSQEGVMYRLHDHTGAVVSDGWVHGGGELSWSVDPSKGYFVTMVTGNEDGAVLFPMTEVKRPAEMLASGEAA